MGEAVLFGIAQEVLKNLGSTALKESASAWGFTDQLEMMKNSINTLNDVMLDAEERQADSHAVRGWLERLTAVLYAADDLFDEFTTVVARKHHSGGNKMTREVCTFFSSSNEIALAFKISRNIKKIRQELDDLVKDATKYYFVGRPHDEGMLTNNASRKSDQTDSFVDEHEVIGRDGDKKAVMDLLSPSSFLDEDELLTVIPIVGMGGMGKTTLAGLIFDEPQLQDRFELSLWVCVSDAYDCKTITEEILKYAVNWFIPILDMDPLQNLLWKVLGDKKYFLVLDDVWVEQREELLKLRDLLKIGRKGSKILVTTQSKAVAEILSTSPPHELQGLSEDSSWNLFERMAFKHGQSEQNPQLVKVGKEIVKKCGHVPLLIRTLGGLLYGKQESKWLSVVKDASLAKIPDNQTDIMSILKISYDHLSSPLRNCFEYCALFPKDYWFDKEKLIQLWIAEGFIAANEGQCVEEVGEEYFLDMLQRGIFKDIIRYEWGAMDCKMHNYMRDVALQMAGCKFKAAMLDEQIFDDKILHISFTYPMSSSQKIPIKSMLNIKLLRTFLLLGRSLANLSIPQHFFKRFSNVRVLGLRNVSLKNLPSSIGELIHLRYLDLSENNFKKLPNSITNLWNLQTLKLFDCSNLRTLPKNMRKLTNLRVLDVGFCFELNFIPSGIGGMIFLNKLPKFIVGYKHSASNLKGKTAGSAKLSDLKNLNSLRGELDIDIVSNENNMLEAAEADLSCKHGLTGLRIWFVYDGLYEDDEAVCDHDEVVLEALNPPSNIKSLGIHNYKGQKLPSWARMNNLCITLPNLVNISLHNCNSCQELPMLSQLHFLKQLEIYRMENVEYMERDIPSSLFFPSLEVLELQHMKNLKGWCKEEAVESKTEIEGQLVPISMQFSKLSNLCIVDCPNLRRLPLCPNVEELELSESNEWLSVSKMVTTMMMPSCSWSGCKLKKLKIDNAEDLMFLPNHCLHQLSGLEINEDGNLESTDRLGEVFATLSSNLKYLQFEECNKLRSISKGMEHLSALKELSFEYCEELDITGNEDDDEGGGMPWKALNTSLRSLTLNNLPKLLGLPSGLQHLSNLCSLNLSSNDELKELPGWISCLTSLIELQLFDCPKLKCFPEAFRNLTTLKNLNIWTCPGLTARCQRPNGIDWPKIQHIPFVDVK